MRVEVRLAQPADRAWLGRLRQESAVYGIPYGRSIPNRAVQARSRASLEQLWQAEDVEILVAVDQQGQRLGYLILLSHQLEPSTGEAQAVIYDLAVEPRHWGTRVVRELVQEAARRTAAKGLAYLVGEVSADNQRALQKALRLGFQVERHQIVMGCDPTGSAPMPGRPEDQKAHLQSRKKRRIDPGGELSAFP